MVNYSHQHRLYRKTLEPQVAAGGVECWRCGELIEPGEPWDLGHSDEDKSLWLGPEHRRCNRSSQARGRPTAYRRSREDPDLKGTSRTWRSRDW